MPLRRRARAIRVEIEMMVMIIVGVIYFSFWESKIFCSAGVGV